MRPWIVTFDCASDAHRRAIHRILGLHGIRILFTVYEIRADEATMASIIEQLRPHIGPADHLLALPHCDNCRQAIAGATIEHIPAEAWIAP